MKHLSLLTLVGCAAVMIVTSAAEIAVAQSVCPEGRTLSGACINPGLASSARTGAILGTQQKFSYSARLLPPSKYSTHPKAYDYREYYYYQQFQPFNGPGGFLYSCHPNC